MARKRMIDPRIWSSEDFSKLSTLSKLIFIGLFSNADDEGRGKANPIYIKSILFPYDEKMRVTDITQSLSEIATNMSCTFYTHDGKEYYALRNWTNFQTINKPTQSAFPSPTVSLHEDYGSTTEGLPPKEEIEVEKEDNIFLPSPQEVSDSIAIELTLNDKSLYPIFETSVKEWAELYPAVDIMQELRGMKAWLNANPTKRKTKSGITRFINSWLMKKQDRGGNIAALSTKKERILR